MIGPNGAGKSTMFNLITGDVAPTAGRVVFGGTDMTAMPPHARSRLGIGRSYQIPHPFANMSVFENLLVGAIFGGGATERESYERCSDVLKITGLLRQGQRAGAHADACCSASGWSLRARFAIQPKLLLLDEIAGGLTEYECGELVKTIKEIHARGTTIVWIEHIVHALVSVASRLIVMNFGQILAQGDPQRGDGRCRACAKSTWASRCHDAVADAASCRPSTATSRRCSTSTSPSTKARRSPSSAPTAPARPRSCARSRARSRPRPTWSCSTASRSAIMTPHEIVRLGIAMVPEGRKLFPSLSVEENLLLGGHCGRPGPWNLDRVYELFPRLHELRRLPATDTVRRPAADGRRSAAR